MTIRGILFDKDGTLLDFNATWVPVIREVVSALADGDRNLTARMLEMGGQDDAAGIVRPGSLLASANTREIALAWRDLLPHRRLDDMIALMDEMFQSGGAARAVPVPGLVETVALLRNRGFRLGVASSDSRDGITASMAAFDVLDAFEFIAGYDSGFGAKPDPGMVLAFCRAADLTPAAVMVVGDNRHDLEMGRNAGAGACVGVLTGTSGREHLADLADHVVGGIADLPGLL